MQSRHPCVLTLFIPANQASLTAGQDGRRGQEADTLPWPCWWWTKWTLCSKCCVRVLRVHQFMIWLVSGCPQETAVSQPACSGPHCLPDSDSSNREAPWCVVCTSLSNYDSKQHLQSPVSENQSTLSATQHLKMLWWAAAIAQIICRYMCKNIYEFGVICSAISRQNIHTGVI